MRPCAGELEDIMESFFLSETLKYMYLLLANGTAVNDHYVFTTGGGQHGPRRCGG